MSTRNLYGSSYAPLGDLHDEDVGDLVDFIDPLGMRKIPEKIKAKVDGYIETKTQRAAQVASQRVEQGVRRAMNDASSSAMAFAAGGVLVGVVAGGAYWYQRSQAKKAGAR